MQRPLDKRISFATNVPNYDSQIQREKAPSCQKGEFCLLQLQDIDEPKNLSPAELIQQYKTTLDKLRKIRSQLHSLNINPDEL